MMMSQFSAWWNVIVQSCDSLSLAPFAPMRDEMMTKELTRVDARLNTQAMKVMTNHFYSTWVLHLAYRAKAEKRLKNCINKDYFCK